MSSLCILPYKGFTSFGCLGDWVFGVLSSPWPCLLLLRVGCAVDLSDVVRVHGPTAVWVKTCVEALQQGLGLPVPPARDSSYFRRTSHAVDSWRFSPLFATSSIVFCFCLSRLQKEFNQQNVVVRHKSSTVFSTDICLSTPTRDAQRAFFALLPRLQPPPCYLRRRPPCHRFTPPRPPVILLDFRKQMNGCSFHIRNSDSSSSNDGGEISSLRRGRGRRRRLRSTAEVLGLYLDEGLLLVIVTAGLLLVLAAMCALDTWLRGHPDGIDRFLPRRFRSPEGRRMQHVSTKVLRSRSEDEGSGGLCGGRLGEESRGAVGVECRGGRAS